MAEVLHILLLELGSPGYIQTLPRVDIQIFWSLCCRPLMQHLVNLLRGLPRGFANPGLKSMAKEGAPVVSTAFFAPKKTGHWPPALRTRSLGTIWVTRFFISLGGSAWHVIFKRFKVWHCRVTALIVLKRVAQGRIKDQHRNRKSPSRLLQQIYKNMGKSAQVPCYIKGVSNKASLSSPLVERTWSCITSLTRRARQYVPPANICGSCWGFLFPYFLGKNTWIYEHKITWIFICTLQNSCMSKGSHGFLNFFRHLQWCHNVAHCVVLGSGRLEEAIEDEVR